MTTKVRNAQIRENGLLIAQRKLFIIREGFPSSQGSLTRKQWEYMRHLKTVVDNAMSSIGTALFLIKRINKSII